jgi:hypothetical protein
MVLRSPAGVVGGAGGAAPFRRPRAGPAGMVVIGCRPSGARGGIQIMPVIQGIAQLRSRWG